MTPPLLNLVVIRAADPDRSAEFYRLLGLTFTKHRHGTGPEHYAAEGSVVFEIYPRGAGEATAATRLGFRVADLDTVIESLLLTGIARMISPPASTEWGYRAVLLDPDGHKVELVEARVEAREVAPTSGKHTQLAGAPPLNRMFP